MTCPLNLKCIPVRAAERPHEIVSVRVLRGILLSCIVIALLAVPASAGDGMNSSAPSHATILTYATLVMVLISGILILKFTEDKNTKRVEVVNRWSIRIIPALLISLYFLLFLTLMGQGSKNGVI
ncbi:MAG: hypothetical protein ABR999_01835 [Methanoregula sp.]|uniref:hypothetical protein n=1 Tax=Methanoregula sp. TaxID=2052170 RepID=UPI003D130339